MAMKIKFLKNSKEEGVVFVDAIIAIAIISIAFVALLQVSEASIKLSSLLKKKTDALMIAEEIMEVTRSFSDGTDWSVDGLGSLSTGVSYYANLNTGSSPATWELLSGEETTGIYTRKVVVDRVSRDVSTGGIEAVYNPVNDDDDTRKVTVTVEWESNSLQLVAYFTNWQ
jgi:hypothetical protein